MKPFLTSSSGSGDNEPFRIKRLEKILKIYNIQVADLFEENSSNIISLHDRKGQLIVIWNNEPSENKKSHIKLIWEMQNEYDVIHEVEN